MPHADQNGGSSGESYMTDAHRFVDTKPKQVVLSIKPMNLENAKDWVGAANTYGDDGLVEHFVAEAERLKD